MTEERHVIPAATKLAIKRMVAGLPDPLENDGLVVTVVGQGFSGDLVSRGGRWRTKNNKFRIKVVPKTEKE